MNQNAAENIRLQMLAALAGPAYQEKVLQRATNYEGDHPKDENSFYGGTAADLWFRFPPEKGFLVYPQFRLGQLPENRDDIPAGTGTVDNLGTLCHCPASTYLTPDTLVTYVPYQCVAGQPPAGKPHPQLAVVLVEVKPFLDKKTEVRLMKEHDRQISQYLQRLNDDYVRHSRAMEPYQHMIHGILCPGVLLCGSRCFRYNVTLDHGDLIVTRQDQLDDPTLSYYNSEDLCKWMANIRAHFESFNHVADNVRFPNLIVHDVRAFGHKVDYEAYMHGYIYTALTTQWRISDGFIVKPQAMLYEVARYDRLRHARVNSYAEWVKMTDGRAADFMLAYFNGTNDTAVMAIEVKQDLSRRHKRDAAAQLNRYMTIIHKASGMRIPGLAIHGNQCWYVGWNNDTPATDNIYAVDGENLDTIFDQNNPFWNRYVADWTALVRDFHIQ